uniref:Uncharacterized protein n=1 Tax=Rhizophora mucronata TaxID=61149 RepID=A0A2P2P7X9_RHIMU
MSQNYFNGYKSHSTYLPIKTDRLSNKRSP